MIRLEIHAVAPILRLQKRRWLFVLVAPFCGGVGFCMFFDTPAAICADLRKSGLFELSPCLCQMGCPNSKESYSKLPGSQHGACACRAGYGYVPFISYYFEDESTDMSQRTKRSAFLTGHMELWQCRIRIFVPHMYVVFEAGGFWWSLEKGSNGVRLNSSKRSDKVIMQWEGTARISPVKLGELPVLPEINIATLERMAESETRAPYTVFGNNCVQFAKTVFGRATGLEPVDADSTSFDYDAPLFLPERFQGVCHFAP